MLRGMEPPGPLAILRFIKEFHAIHGRLPSFRAIGKGLDIKSPQTVRERVEWLMEKKYLEEVGETVEEIEERQRHRRPSYRLPPPERPIWIPVRAGLLRENDSEKRITVGLSIAWNGATTEKLFAVRLPEECHAPNLAKGAFLICSRAGRPTPWVVCGKMEGREEMITIRPGTLRLAEGSAWLLGSLWEAGALT